MKIVPLFRAVLMIFRLGPEKILELERKAFVDSLTGLHNHGALGEVGEKEVERAKRYGHSLSVIFLDLDNLKPINDRFGHSAGDEALRGVAGLLRRVCRKIDSIFRYGGDEFVVVAPETGRKGAERLVQRIKDEPLFVGEARIQMSCGIAVWHQGLLFSDLLKEADQKMYLQKKGEKK